MQPAPDAQAIDTTHSTVDEVVDAIEALVRDRAAV
jgi:cytidylate kinase